MTETTRTGGEKARLSIQGFIEKWRATATRGRSQVPTRYDPQAAASRNAVILSLERCAADLASLLPTLQIEQEQTTEKVTRMGTPKVITDDNRTASEAGGDPRRRPRCFCGPTPEQRHPDCPQHGDPDPLYEGSIKQEEMR